MLVAIQNVSAIHVHIKNEIAQYLFAWHMIETIVNVNAGVSQLKTGSSKSISRLHMPHFFVVYRYVHGQYSKFLLLGISSPWLLLAVSLTRHFPLLAITQRFLYSTYPMKGITCIFTQTFHYPTFKLLDVSALPSRLQWMSYSIAAQEYTWRATGPLCENMTS